MVNSVTTVPGVVKETTFDDEIKTIIVEMKVPPVTVAQMPAKTINASHTSHQTKQNIANTHSHHHVSNNSKNSLSSTVKMSLTSSSASMIAIGEPV